MRAIVLVLLAAFAVAPLTAFAAESHVWVKNLTDKSVWVTAFKLECHGNKKVSPLGGVIVGGDSCTERHIVHEWCVPPANGPRDVSKQGFHYPLTVVHVLVTENKNCGRPIIKDWTLKFPANSGTQSITEQYNVVTKLENGVNVYDVRVTTP